MIYAGQFEEESNVVIETASPIQSSNTQLLVNTSAFYAFVTRVLLSDEVKTIRVSFLGNDIIAVANVSSVKGGYNKSFDLSDHVSASRIIASTAANCVHIIKPGNLSTATQVLVEVQGKRFVYDLSKNLYDPLSCFKQKNAILYSDFEACIFSFLSNDNKIRILSKDKITSKNADVIETKPATPETSDLLITPSKVDNKAKTENKKPEPATSDSVDEVQDIIENDVEYQPFDFLYKVSCPSGTISLPPSLAPITRAVRLIELALINSDFDEKNVLTTYLGGAYAAFFLQVRKILKTIGIDVVFDPNAKQVMWTSTSDDVFKKLMHVDVTYDQCYRFTIRSYKENTFVGTFANVLNSKSKYIDVKNSKEKSPLGFYMYLRQPIEDAPAAEFLSNFKTSGQSFWGKNLNKFLISWQLKGSTKFVQYPIYDSLFMLFAYAHVLIHEDLPLWPLLDYVDSNNAFATLVTRAFHHGASDGCDNLNGWADLSVYRVFGFENYTTFTLSSSSPTNTAVFNVEDVCGVVRSNVVNLPVNKCSMIYLQESEARIPDGAFIWGVCLSNPFLVALPYGNTELPLVTGEFQYSEDTPIFKKLTDFLLTPFKAVKDAAGKIIDTAKEVVNGDSKGVVVDSAQSTTQTFANNFLDVSVDSILKTTSVSPEALENLVNALQGVGIHIPDLLSRSISSRRIKFDLTE